MNLISINDLSEDQINQITKSALNEFEINQSKQDKQLTNRGQILVNFFFENSTRTRTSFEIAAKNLGIRVININIALSSLKKGETIEDTTKTINAMNPNFVVIRHNCSGIVNKLAKFKL